MIDDGLAGTRSFVTGAGTAAGRAVTQALIRHGALVVALDADWPSADDSLEAGGTVLGHFDLLQDDPAVRVAELARDHGPPDNLVLVLPEDRGQGSSPGPGQSDGPSAFDQARVLALSLAAVLSTVKRRGSVVLLRGANPRAGHDRSPAPNHTVSTLTRNLGATLRPLGVRVNAVSFRLSDLPAQGPGTSGASCEQGVRGPERAEQVVLLVLCLLSEPVSQHLTGACVDVDGGLSLGPASASASRAPSKDNAVSPHAASGPTSQVLDIESVREPTLEVLRRLVRTTGGPSRVGIDELEGRLREAVPGFWPQALGFPSLPIFLEWVAIDSEVSVEVNGNHVGLRRAVGRPA